MARINTKAKGTAAERELLHRFWDAGWASMRAAGSGSMRYPCPDIIAGNARRKLGIEVKITKASYKFLSENEIKELEFFCRTFGCEGYVAVKFAGQDWFFLMLEDLKETGAGFSITPAMCLNKGLSFEQLIEA